MTQLQTHELDLLALGTGLKWPEYASLAADPRNGLKALRVDAFAWSHVDFNLKQPIVCRSSGTPCDRLRDRPQRDHQQSAARIGNPGGYRPAAALLLGVYHGRFALSRTIRQRRKALLDADGWKVGPDGIRVKNGQRLEFTLEHADRIVER